MKPFSLIDKAIHDYGLISDGDKILLGVSGGKDSTFLAEYLSKRAQRPNSNFVFSALNIATEISPPVPEQIVSLFRQWNIDYKSISIDLAARLKSGHKMNCYWCSLNRRMELNNYAIAHGYNKLALAHHTDDVLETLLMNALDKCTFSTMIPILQYDKYPVAIIRPLYYVSEERIINYAKMHGYFGFTCTCDYQSQSARKVARQRLEALTGGDERLKSHLLAALSHVDTKYLP